MAQGHPESERLGGGGWSARFLTMVLLAAPALLPFPPCSAIPSCPGSPVPLTLRICSDHVLSPPLPKPVTHSGVRLGNSDFHPSKQHPCLLPLTTSFGHFLLQTQHNQNFPLLASGQHPFRIENYYKEAARYFIFLQCTFQKIEMFSFSTTSSSRAGLEGEWHLGRDFSWTFLQAASSPQFLFS